MKRALPWLALMLALPACLEVPENLVEPETEAPEVEQGQSRSLELRFQRLDVEGYEQTVTLDDLQALPDGITEDLWLLDLDLRPLSKNALDQLVALPVDEVAALPPAAQNLRRLMTMTPDNAELEGTSLEELIGLAGNVGIPPAKALGNLMSIGVTDRVVSTDVAANSLVAGIVGSHPNAQTRPGPVDDEHPDGRWPVEPGFIPLTLKDVATNFEELETRLGPAGEHPGVVEEAKGFVVVEDDFRFIIRVTANALPFKGVDLTNADEASVNSLPSQIETLYNFDDPDWIQMEGLIEDPAVERLTLTVFEEPTFVPGGTERIEPNGSSPAWDLDPWTFERIIIEVSQAVADNIEPHCDLYELGTGVDAFEACVAEDRWVTMETFNDVGNPPTPSYFWDLLLEISQVRLHDGGLAEGEGDIKLTLEDIPIGITADQIVDQIKVNLMASPANMEALAVSLVDTAEGDADFYYYVPEDLDGDYLLFVNDGDIRLDENGEPVRPYAYDNPGFFSDQGLGNKVSSTDELDGDTTHEKVRIEAGDSLFVEDDQGRVFRIDVGEKPSRFRIALDVTRVG